MTDLNSDFRKRLENLDPDAWFSLYQDNPDQADIVRSELLHELISQAPESQQARLKGMQFVLDQKRALAKTPLKAAMMMSSEMFDRLYDLNKALQGLTSPSIPLPHARKNENNIISIDEKLTDI